MAAVEEWISVAEAAHTLKKSERTIRRQCEAGKLRARLDSTASGKTWFVCLTPAPHDAPEVATQTATIADTSSTRSEEAADTADTANTLDAEVITGEIEATAIVPHAQNTQVLATATPADNSELLAQMSEVRHEVENIKIYLAGQMSAQMDERLATLPTRDNLREDVAAIMSSALTPVMQRVEELAATNSQLSAINAQLETELHVEKQKNLAQVRRPWWKKLFS